MIPLLPTLAVLACAAQPRPKTIEPEAQTYAQAIAMMCNVDTLAGLTPTSSELERSEARTNFIIDNITNGDAIFFATVWRTKVPSEQSPLLAEQARKAGIGSCALADALRTIPSD